MDQTWFFVEHYALIAAFAVVSYLLGARLTRGTDYRGAAEKVSFCTALGLGLISHFVLAAGLLHILTNGVMLAVLTAITLISLPPVSVVREWVARISGKLSSLNVTLAVLTVALAIPILQMSLYPPTQWDAISYHLAAAKIYVREGAVVYTPYLRFPVFPQSSEMLFTLSLLLADDITAQLTQFLMMALTALALYGWGRREFTPRAGVLAAVLWLSNPLILWLGAGAYVDAGLALYLTLALYSLRNWRASEAENQGRVWLMISAALFGFAAATKYLALFPILCAGIYLLAYAAKRRSLRPVLTFSLITIAVACPWYLRNAWYTGNPVWPYFPEWLGYGPWNAADIVGQKFEQNLHGMGRGFSALLSLPWNVFAHADKFGGTGYFLSPAYLALLPLAAASAFWNRTSSILLLAAALYTGFWFGTVQALRYLLPVFPIVSLCGAAALERIVFRWNGLRRPVFSNMATALLGLVFLGVGLWLGPKVTEFLHRDLPRGLPPVTAEQRSAYLKAAIDPYQAIEYLNRTRGENYRVFSIPSTNIAYFTDGTFMGDWMGPARYLEFAKYLERPEDLQRELDKHQADFFLVHADGPLGYWSYNQVLDEKMLRGRMKLLLATHSILLFEIQPDPVDLVIGPELVQSGGLEGPPQSVASVWAHSAAPGADQLDAQSHTGTAAYRSDGRRQLFQRVPVNPGALYRHQMYTRADKPDQYARLQMHWFDRNEKFIRADWRIVEARDDDAIDEWRRRAMADQAPANTASVLIFASAHDGSEVWVDDLSLVEMKYK